MRTIHLLLAFTAASLFGFLWFLTGYAEEPDFGIKAMRFVTIAGTIVFGTVTFFDALWKIINLAFPRQD